MIRDNFLFFWSGASPFSNFYISPFKMDDLNFVCSEQAYMYLKAMHFGDTYTAQMIMDADTPRDQKNLGRQVVGFSADEWSKHSYEVMLKCCKKKFELPNLKQQLLDSKPLTLAEASPYDLIWGIGLSEEDPRALKMTQWPGKNLLGKVLMEIRSEI